MEKLHQYQITKKKKKTLKHFFFLDVYTDGSSIHQPNAWDLLKSCSNDIQCL